MLNRTNTNQEPNRGYRRHIRTASRFLGVGLLFTLIGYGSPASAVPAGGGPGGGTGTCSLNLCHKTFLPLTGRYNAQCTLNSIWGFGGCYVVTDLWGLGNQSCVFTGEFQSCSDAGASP